MTRKEKAKELVGRFLRSGMIIEPAKRCSLICIDEKINTLESFCKKYKLTGESAKFELNELMEIKQEIKNL